MPTQSTTYNSRVTDEALEKRFRDTFRSQGGAELVDDLYAQGVIVPVVDFTSAATGTQLSQNLQTAWDFTTGSASVSNGTSTFITNSGFWQVDCTVAQNGGGGSLHSALIFIDDGATTKNIFGFQVPVASQTGQTATAQDKFVVFLRAGDSLKGSTSAANMVMDVWYRQIATVTGDLVDPSGFTSS